MCTKPPNYNLVVPPIHKKKSLFTKLYYKLVLHVELGYLKMA